MNFIPAEIVAVDGGRAVRVPARSTARPPSCRSPATTASSPRAAQVILGIRPEHIFRDDPDLRRSKPAIAPLTAPVEVVEPTGAETIAVLRFGGREVVGRFDPDSAPRMGEKHRRSASTWHTPACSTPKPSG